MIHQSDITIEELYKAFYDCIKRKHNTQCAQIFEANLEHNINTLYNDLINQTYQLGRSICFIVTKPKVREVWAADFRDRVVHHLLYNRYSPIFHKSFIYDSYACLPGKGTLRAAKRLQQFIRSSTENTTKPSNFLKIDIANFFMTIDKDILFGILSKKILHPWWLWLTRVILYHDPATDVHVKSNKVLLSKVPKQKSLFNRTQNKGLPIGNLSSQFFANIYLNELDQYAKHTLKLKYYVRYVDDIVIIDRTKDLYQLYLNINIYLETHLRLKLHPNKLQINNILHGINFVGYIIKHYTLYIRKRTIKAMYRKAKVKLPSINSYLGMLKHANTYNIRRMLSINNPELKFDCSYYKVTSVY